jgi:hypothetical protein
VQWTPRLLSRNSDRTSCKLRAVTDQTFKLLYKRKPNPESYRLGLASFLILYNPYASLPYKLFQLNKLNVRLCLEFITSELQNTEETRKLHQNTQIRKQKTQASVLNTQLQNKKIRSRGNLVGIANRIQGRPLKSRGSIPGTGKRFFSLPHNVYTGSTSLLQSGCPGMNGLGREAATHLSLVPTLRIRGSLHPLPQTSSGLSA